MAAPSLPAPGRLLTHKFNAEQTADFRTVFDEADEDKSGSIETAELKKVIEKCGIEVSDTQVKEMIKDADTDKSGTLEFDEFLNLMWRLQSGPSERELRNELFSVLDDNMDGFVDVDELRQLFIKAKNDTNGAVAIPSDALLKQMIAEGSSDGGPQMSFDDFVALLEQVPQEGGK